MDCRQTATQKSTISPLKVLSKDEPEEQRNNNGEQAARDPTLTGPQTAGMTSGVSGEVDKGTLSPALLENGYAHDVIREILDDREKRLMHVSMVQNLDLKPDAEGIDEEARRTRTAQRLGPGTGIGA